MAKTEDKRWEKVESTIVRFEQVGDECKGKLIGTEPNAQFGGTVYKLADDGKTLSVFGTAVLDSQMKGILPGEEVRIVYVGDKPNKNKSLHDIKLFEVYKRA